MQLKSFIKPAESNREDKTKEIMIATRTHTLDCADIKHRKSCEIQSKCALKPIPSTAVQINTTPSFFKGSQNGRMAGTRTTVTSISFVNQIKIITDFIVADLGAIGSTLFSRDPERCATPSSVRGDLSPINLSVMNFCLYQTEPQTICRGLLHRW